MSLIISLTFIIIVSFLFGRIAEKFHFSKEIGLIIAGIILSLPFFRESIIAGNENIIGDLANIGLFALMFLAGFEVSWRMLVKEKEEALAITFFTVASSLLLGFFVFKFLGFESETALIMGICFSVTAEATKARALIQLKKLKTKLGALMLGAGILNDIIGVISLVIITYLFTSRFSIVEFGVLVGVIISFFGGILFHFLHDRQSSKLKALEKLLLLFVVPLFFINLGLSFNLESLVIDFRILLIVIITSFTGQMIGVFLSKPITKLKFKQLYLVGWGMNSKGVVELAIAFVAFQAGILPVNLYSALVVTALLGTILFQIIFFRTVRKDPGIMN